MTRLPAGLVSGGQTGADRAALDVAIELGIRYGGWCPQGGWAEDRPEPPGLLADYPALRESPSPVRAERTRLNVLDSDATLVVRDPGASSPGSDLTVALAREAGRPLLVTAGGDAAEVAAWLATLGDGIVLNVAGPRESQQPGIYGRTRALLLEVLGEGHSGGSDP